MPGDRNLPGGQDSLARQLGTQAARNAQTLLVLSVAQRALSLLTLVILARVLPIDQLGALGSALALASVVGSVADLGIESATLRSLSLAIERDEGLGPILGASLFLRTCLGVGVLVASEIFVLALPFPRALRPTAAVALLTMVNPVWSTYGAVLQARLQIGKLRLISISSFAAAAIVSTVVALTGGNAFGVILAQVVISTAFSPLVVLAGRKWAGLSFLALSRHAREIGRFAWSLGASQLLGSIYYRLDTVLLSMLAPVAAVGYYYASYRLTESLSIFSSAIVVAAFPAIARLSESDSVASTRLAARMVRIVTAFGVAITIVGVAATPALIGLVYGARYSATIFVTQTLLAAVLLMFMNTALYQTSVAQGNSKLILKATFVGLAVNVVANVVLIPRLRAEGAAVATVLTEGAVAAVGLRWAMSTFRIRAGRLLSRGFAVTLVFASTLWLTQRVPIYVSPSIGVAGAILAVGASGLVGRHLLAEVRSLNPLRRFRRGNSRE